MGTRSDPTILSNKADADFNNQTTYTNLDPKVASYEPTTSTGDQENIKFEPSTYEQVRNRNAVRKHHTFSNMTFLSHYLELLSIISFPCQRN